MGKLRHQSTSNFGNSANWLPKRLEPGLGITAASGKYSYQWFGPGDGTAWISEGLLPLQQGPSACLVAEHIFP